MSFLFPAWLWAAGAALVPLVIHLLSRGRGRVVLVGTTRFLPTSRSHRLRRFRPSGLLRLLLRAALLAALAAALAGPRAWRSPDPRPKETWALVDPALLAARERLAAEAPEVLRRLETLDGDQRLLLAPGLPEAGRAKIPATAPAAASDDLWSLVAEGAALAPPDAGLEVFVLDRAEALRGRRPDLGRPFEWWSVPDPRPNRWIQRAVGTPDGLRVTVGESTASGTAFASGTLSHDDGMALGIAREADAGGDRVELLDGGSRASDDRTLVPAPVPLRAEVRAAPDRAGDATTVGRAVRAVAEHLGRPLVLAREGRERMDPLVEPGSTATTERLDLLVELGARAGEGMPPAAVRLLDGAGAGRPCEAAVFAAALPDPWLELRRCVTGGAGPGYWPDAAGRPLLSVEALPAGVDAGTATYRWRGRFDPDWSSVTDAALPHLLLGLVAPNDERLNGAPDPESDRRAAPSGHGRPRRSSTSPASARVAPDPLPERLAWLAVAALFLLDRLLVGRPR